MLKEISKKTLSGNGCNAQRTSGDLLFCGKCRKRWEKVCVLQGIAETQVDEDELNKFLKEYQGEGIQWEV